MKKYSILLVEKDDLIRRMLVKKLSPFFHTLTTSSGRRANKILAGQIDFDLIILTKNKDEINFDNIFEIKPEDKDIVGKINQRLS